MNRKITFYISFAILFFSTAFFFACKKKAKDSPIIWEVGDCNLVGNGDFSSCKVAKWLGSRVYYSGKGGNRVVTIQLMRAGTQGSFLFPADGWLCISYNVETSQFATIPITNSVFSQLPLSVPVNEATVVYYDDSTGYKMPVNGSIVFSDNMFDMNGETGTFNVGMDFSQMYVTMHGADIPLTGSMAISGDNIPIPPSPSTSAASGGSTDPNSSAGCNINQSSYNNYFSQCQAGGIAPCYCCSAALYHSYCKYPEEQAERAKAAQLGTTCSY